MMSTPNDALYHPTKTPVELIATYRMWRNFWSLLECQERDMPCELL